MMLGGMIHPTVACALGAEGVEGLSEAEGRTYAALPEHRRADWLAGRIALKRAASAALGVAAGELMVPARPGGSPRIFGMRADGGTSVLPANASVAHRDGRAAAVVASGRAIGIDLERSGSVHPAQVRYFLSEREQRSARHDPTVLWCLKEAAWKALECDGSVPFGDLELNFGTDGNLLSVVLDDRTLPACALVTSPVPGYVLAVVWVEDGAR
jgi:phosphopantetheinyl transferase